MSLQLIFNNDSKLKWSESEISNWCKLERFSSKFLVNFVASRLQILLLVCSWVPLHSISLAVDSGTGSRPQCVAISYLRLQRNCFLEIKFLFSTFKPIESKQYRMAKSIRWWKNMCHVWSICVGQKVRHVLKLKD